MTHADYCDPPDIGIPARPTRVYRVSGLRPKSEPAEPTLLVLEASGPASRVGLLAPEVAA